jgi:ATP-dependent exoDNAse (exonuclease V) beta subunit
MNDFMDLKTPYQPLTLVKAGAGAGKTYHIQKTTVEWVKQGHVKADRILAVTFTNAAAAEMRERIRLALMAHGLVEEASLVRNAQISTIHVFGLSVLERFCFELGLSPSPRQLTDEEKDVLIKLSLADVSIIDTILDDLGKWSYKQTVTSAGWETAVDQFKKTILNLIHKLRIIAIEYNEEELDRLVTQAADYLKCIYKEQPFKEETLNNQLWKAVDKIQDKYKADDLLQAWGSNKDTRDFVDALFKVTEEQLKSDWKLWVQLQQIETAPKIYNKKGDLKHEDSQLAFDVWDAAKYLNVHPSPLREAIAHATILISSAFEALDQYQSLKRQHSLMDFSDMINVAENMLQNNAWLTEIKNNYDCLIIDEFQDTNPLQFALLWKVQQAGIPALIVGDVKQSIMGFQGADPRLFQSLLAENEQAVEELANNWRSSNELMMFINAMGSHLYGEQYQSLAPRSDLKSELEAVHLIEFHEDNWSRRGTKSGQQSFDNESANVVVQEVKRLLESGTSIVDKRTKNKRPIQPNDIAILANRKKRLAVYADALRQAGIQPQIAQTGWFESCAISYMCDALAYLSNPRDTQSAMSIKVLHAKEATLQHALQSHIDQKGVITLEADILERLKSLISTLKFTSVSEIVSSAIEALDLWSRFVLERGGEQQRANLLKLIKKAEEFEAMQPETLQAQGIFGKSLSSFLIWLNMNAEQFDNQPDIDSDNQQAVVLHTWHGSKGLEWPIVIVDELDRIFDAEIPEMAVAYEGDKNVSSMLENAYVQVIPAFDDDTIEQRFVDELQPRENDTLKNLTYVAMTRAREQLILPWFDNGKGNTMLANLRDLDFSAAKRTAAKVPLIKDGELPTPPKPYGRVAIIQADQLIPNNIQLAVISPSLIVKQQPGKVKETLNDFTQQKLLHLKQTVDLTSIRKKHSAAQVGDWLHYSYQALLACSDLKERLWACLPELAKYPDLCEQITRQVSVFKATMAEAIGVTAFKAEYAMLAKSDAGAVVSGIIDCLLETDAGYYIIDHKTDEDSGDKALEHHLQQLAAYAKYLKLDKPILGIGINWIREGCVQLSQIQE